MRRYGLQTNLGAFSLYGIKAKMRKGKMGKGLADVLIEEFDWVNSYLRLLKIYSL